MPIISTPNVESAAVAAKRSEFQAQFAQIAAEHARYRTGLQKVIPSEGVTMVLY